MPTSEGYASTENDIRIRGTLPAANNRVCIRGVLLELLVTDIANRNGVSLVLLQMLYMAEQRFVELRIILLDFLSKDRRFNLHLLRNHINDLHKARYAVSQRQINALGRAWNGQPRIGNHQRIGVAQTGDDGRDIGVENGAFLHFLTPLAKRFAGKECRKSHGDKTTARLWKCDRYRNVSRIRFSPEKMKARTFKKMNTWGVKGGLSFRKINSLIFMMLNKKARKPRFSGFFPTYIST
jgi:hypothetical protein